MKDTTVLKAKVSGIASLLLAALACEATPAMAQAPIESPYHSKREEQKDSSEWWCFMPMLCKKDEPSSLLQDYYDVAPPREESPQQTQPVGEDLNVAEDLNDIETQAGTGSCQDHEWRTAELRKITRETEMRRATAQEHYVAALRVEHEQINKESQAQQDAIYASRPQGDHFEIFLPMNRVFAARDEVQQNARARLEEARERHAREYRVAIGEINATEAILRHNVLNSAPANCK